MARSLDVGLTIVQLAHAFAKEIAMNRRCNDSILLSSTPHLDTSTSCCGEAHNFV